MRLTVVLRTESYRMISIHAPRVRCDLLSEKMGLSVAISIHAPRVRCDKIGKKDMQIIGLISIHAPRVRCDTIFYVAVFAVAKFQSTHLV